MRLALPLWMPASLFGNDAAWVENALSPSASAPAKLAINALRDMGCSFSWLYEPAAVSGSGFARTRVYVFMR